MSLTGCLDMLLLLAAAGADPGISAADAVEQSLFRGWLFLLVDVGVVLMVAGLVACLWRMIRGPQLADRVVAGDVLALQVVGLVILLTIRMESTAYIDLALAIAILGFASSLAFAQYIAALDPGRREA